MTLTICSALSARGCVKSSPKILVASCPFTPLTASSMLSAIGCEKFQTTPGILCNFAVHGRDQLVFVLDETCGRHCSLGFKSDEVFGIEKAGGIGTVVRTAGLTRALASLRETKQRMSRA